MHFHIPLNFNDHVWLLDFSKYKNGSGIFSLRFFSVLILGIIISILLFVLAVSLINARTKSLQIQVLNEELKKANVSKDRFISVLAHDLKSPFNTLLGFSELLTENFNDLDNATKEQYVDQIHSLAQVTYQLLEELLMWAMVQSGQFPFKPKKLNLTDLCKQLVSDHELIAGKKSITISMDVQKEVFVMADEMMLKTILRNLIVNAIKFTRSYGSISIGFLTFDRKAIVSVSDTGVGISPADRDKLFDMTYVHSKSGTANEKGTGLGLLLCKDMVVKHGGEIWVESVLGFGSTFSFSIPLA
jgi:signal transduction histidine kinase